MAQRYGGKFSPDPSQPDAAPLTPGADRPTRVGMRSNLLFLLPLPLIWRAFTSEPVGLAMYLAALGLLLLAAWLTREGLMAEEAYEARKVARRPALPRKILGSVLTGAGLALAGFVGGGLIPAIIFGVLGTVLHSFAFGLDPLRDKGMEGIDTFQQDRVAKAVDEAETHLAAMTDAILRTRDRALEGHVAAFQKTAREMFRTVEEDPRDLTGAKKYLGVYLLGARDATAKFADLYARDRDTQARADYLSLLDDLQQNFAARTQKMLSDDRTGLDIEIDVLRDRLAREGIRND